MLPPCCGWLRHCRRVVGHSETDPLPKGGLPCRSTRAYATVSLRHRSKAMAQRSPYKPRTKRKAAESVRTLLSRAQIQRRIGELAQEIRRDFPGEPLHMVGVLKGSVFFLTDLARQMTGEISIDFIAVSSYGSGTHSSGEVKLTRDLDSSIEGKTVIVVEDILDTGMTLQYLLRVFEQ